MTPPNSRYSSRVLHFAAGEDMNGIESAPISDSIGSTTRHGRVVNPGVD
uniref:Uncharacterized protein n=1 Tax=Candidatus Kentrum sp. TC TaxID=2126339 RepID=A0A450YET2_9GAMM|nr:MAG: hypothetical protein BECKTC1821E_GA0114239_100614 [Candidatus Kentron sp. TC]VFK50449.1 MAG: hypothetical protein BECKTC1821D_GA0114238_11044 [Candidatus Kentron sp. TC]VFK55871.1 MAG: hypothetical protein BECKTC1821F_GA0114240_100814 [Candidatus Kentron sp. TC]